MPISKIQDLVTKETLSTGAGIAVSLVGGETLAGTVAGIAGVPETDVLKTAGVKAISKIALGAVGTMIASQPDVVGYVGKGMALGGVGGAIADIVVGGIQASTPESSTGALRLSPYTLGLRSGLRLRGLRRLPTRLPTLRTLERERLLQKEAPLLRTRTAETGVVPEFKVTPPVVRKPAEEEELISVRD